MKQHIRFYLILLICLFISSTPLLADWNPGEPYKMHFPQLPDPCGWDICLIHQFLADDFKCTETGPIKDIHFWISWQDDLVGQIVDSYIGIHSNAGGMPGPAIWVWNGQGNFKIIPYGAGNQGWFCPLTMYRIPQDHNSFYQVNITDINEPMTQQSGQVYWLVIRAAVQPETYSVGWKTSVNAPPGIYWGAPAQWSTDLATWTVIDTGQTAPEKHDMAFVITGPAVTPELDFGDAPQGPYPTKLDWNGARHTIVPNLLMGSLIDGEPDGQPSGIANGDDNNNLDDEDGVSFLTPIRPGQWATVSVDLTNCAAGISPLLNAWIDFDSNGNWTDAGDKIFSDLLLTPGIVNVLNFFVPYSAAANFTTFARFRLSTVAGLSYNGPASDGEVEDYNLFIEENPKIKWVQQPDLSEFGIDVKVDDGRVIADDFECKRYGLITDVHFWGSWKYDIVGRIANIHLSIHGDDPAGPGGSDPCNTYSKPDQLLWQRNFSSNEFFVGDRIDLADGEYWWDPIENVLMPQGDRTVWRIDINVPENEAFLQEGSPEEPVIYWLDIRVDTDPQVTGEFGWKTRKYPQHFMDDAVINFSAPILWEELRYPLNHPYEANSIDMAFVITGKDIKRPLRNLKWSQPPIEIDPCTINPIYCGWNEESWVQEPIEPPILIRSAADDFRCIGDMPVTSIHWWGSFINWSTREPPLIMPVGWNLKFYANVPAVPSGEPNFSHPGTVLWEVDIPANRVETEWQGYDEFPNMMPESCFQHYVQLDPCEFFRQAQYLSDTNDNVFWLGITAVYASGTEIPSPWGWKTRPWHWMDDAVRIECIIDPSGGITYRYVPLKDPATGESYDLAYELDTDPNWVKWEQSYTGIRDWPHYEDKVSMANETADGNLSIIRKAADDWLCKRRTPVTSIVWWGSYLGFKYMPCEPITWPLPVKPDYFLITIHTDVAANDPCNEYPFSHPGEKIWEYKAYDYDEVLVGYDKQPETQPGPPREAVFRYSVRLPEEKWFKQRRINQIYWVSIMAVYSATSDPTYQWGWTIHEYYFNDDAVSGHWENIGTERVWKWEEIFDQTGHSADLSFMLFTNPNKCVTCADYDWSGLVTFYDYAIFANEWMSFGLPGGLNDGDLDCDGDVDGYDLKTLCDQWLQGCPP